MRAVATLVLVGLSCASPLVAQKATPLSESELAAITSRGRLIAEYNDASRRAAASIQSRKPAGEITRYIARKTTAGWVVVFGRFSEGKDSFLIVHEVTLENSQLDVKTNDPPEADTGFFFAAAKAIETAMQNAQLEKRPYISCLLPTDSSQFYVYVLPAQTQQDVYPLGGDTRFLVSADGSQIVETRRLHQTVIEVNRSTAAAKKLISGFHTHILTNAPEDTDVFHVLRQANPLPEYIATTSGTYMVTKDGAIKHVK